jgi:hypothetical protein
MRGARVLLPMQATTQQVRMAWAKRVADCRQTSRLPVFEVCKHGELFMRCATPALAAALLAALALACYSAQALLAECLGPRRHDPLLEEVGQVTTRYVHELEATPEADHPAVRARYREEVGKVFRRHGLRPWWLPGPASCDAAGRTDGPS